MMPVVLAFTVPGRAAGAVTTVAFAIAAALDSTVERRPLPTGAGVIRDADDPAVRLVVLPYSAGYSARLATEVIQHCSKPLVLVPVTRGRPVFTSVDRILVPLDGTREAAQAVAETVALFRASGADIVVLHVFDRATVPKFWDQAAHARKSWEAEFLSRYCDQPTVRMEVRSGTPGECVTDVATSEHVDLIALGWGRNLSAGRARTVRSTLARTTIPVLLLPEAAGEGGGTFAPCPDHSRRAVSSSDLNEEASRHE